ncbi:LysR substrate-binding domain-containing protein [Actinomadura sp. B10D3]|uniref:LysR substrate-binding domain-containing protein n=1 Tax=Actinomadura sp. B10D3 TaxID=3153557 RepID=UPI00325D560A
MGLAGVDLNLMVALEALLSERNVTRAAERTSVGQPAMSASLARLRKHFMDPLLVREGRLLVLTPLAESLIGPVRDALNAAEVVMGRSAAFDPTRDERTFTVMASDYTTLVLLRPLLGDLASEAPSVRLNIVPVSANFGDLLRKGQADMLIMPAETVGHGFAFPHRPLFTDRFVLTAHQDNTQVPDRVTIDELVNLSFVTFSGGPLPAILQTQLEALGVRLHVEITTQGFVIAPFLLAGTPLVSFVHERLARNVAAAAGIRFVEHPLPLQPVHEALYWNPRHTEDLAHRWLRERIVTLVGQL